jgi:hypothetical protein
MNITQVEQERGPELSQIAVLHIPHSSRQVPAEERWRRCRTDFTRMREAAGPFPRIGVVGVANALGDGAGLHVTVIDVPAIGAVIGSSAGKVGHAAIEAPGMTQGKRGARDRNAEEAR